MRYNDNERAIIWLDCFGGFTREQKLKIISCTKNPALILSDVSLISKYVGKQIDEKTYSALVASIECGIDKTVLTELEAMGVVAITCMSDDYPEEFLNIPNPPLIIYCKGNVKLLSEKNKFSVVGSRKTLPAIIAKTEELCKELTENGVTIVTGLAEGVESSVIKGALPSGKIISILPGGFKHVYPEFNKALFDKIVEKGLVVSEHNPDVISRPYFFPDRNRLLAALGKGVLVCSAGKKSGTSYTADFANSFGKDVFAFPYTLGVPSGEGCNAMIKEFAMLCDSADDIFTSLGIVKNKKTNESTLSAVEEKVFSCIKEAEIHIDLLLAKTGMKIFEISPVLTMLEIKKYIIKNPGNTYSAIK